MSSIEWHPLARTESFEAAEFYEAQSRGLGKVFFQELDASLDQIRTHPAIGRSIRGDIRRSLLRRFPFSVFYRVDTATPERILVLAVAHQKRRPMYWANRI